MLFIQSDNWFFNICCLDLISHSTSSFLWQVPLTYITSHSSAVQRFLLKSEKGMSELSDIIPNQHIYLLLYWNLTVCLQMCCTCQRRWTGLNLMWTCGGIILYITSWEAGTLWSTNSSKTTVCLAATTEPVWSTTSSSWSGERTELVFLKEIVHQT